MLMLIFSGCSKADPEYVFFKTEIREQLEERAVEYCHGDFKVLKEEEFGPFTRARLQCMKESTKQLLLTTKQEQRN